MLLFLTAFWCGWMKPHKEYPMCRVTILNENGIPVTVEVSREIYQVFVDYEREIERQRKADFRHRDARSWDTCLIFEVSTETLEQTYERIRTLHEIQEALNEFTPKQRRRFLLHFAYGYTYMEIAKMEGSNKSTVMRSAKVALKKIQKKLAA
jgi:DNA-directed RNA polymerase specialized sigma subunit, sigma24 homolog